MQDGVEPGPLTKLRQARGSFELGLCVQAHYLCLMKHLSNRGWAFGAALSLAIVPAVAPAQSIDLNRPLTTLSPAQLQNLNNRERRLDFQQRQQFNREIDSMAIQRQPRPQVPVMKPRCPLQTSGTARTC